MSPLLEKVYTHLYCYVKYVCVLQRAREREREMEIGPKCQ